MYSRIVEHLCSCAANNRFPHSLLFAEREGCGAVALVLEVVKHLFCGDSSNSGDSNTCRKIERLVHPDIHFLFPINNSSVVGKEKRPEVEEFYPLWRELVMENPYFTEQEMYAKFGIENKQGTIGVAEANGVLRKMMLSPYESDKRVFIVLFPERMNQEAANRLLKSIEEPSPGTIFFFISQNPHRVLPTILSRCTLVEVPPLAAEELAAELVKRENLDSKEALYWAEAAAGSYGKALAMIKGGDGEEKNWELFRRLSELSLQRDLPQLLQLSDELASLGRERQKQFCRDALESLRKLYMLSIGMEKIARIRPGKEQEYSALCAALPQSLYEKGSALLNSTVEMIESNVNPKFVFCDMCNRFYFYCDRL